MTQLSGTQRLMEVGMMVTCASAFFLLIALASFHPSDPGWSQAGLHNEINNLMGSVGAWAADILLFTFGITAYVIPFVLAFCGWFIFLHIKKLTELDYLTMGLRIIGMLLLVFGFTGLASLNFDDFYSVSAGGAMGDIIGSALVPHFSFVGTVLLLLCFFCTGFTLTTGISWLSIIDNLGAFTIKGAKNIAELPQLASNMQLPAIGFSREDKQLAHNAATEADQEVKITSLRAQPIAKDEHDKVDSHFHIPDEIFSAEEDLPATPSIPDYADIDKVVVKPKPDRKSVV